MSHYVITKTCGVHTFVAYNTALNNHKFLLWGLWETFLLNSDMVASYSSADGAGRNVSSMKSLKYFKPSSQSLLETGGWGEGRRFSVVESIFCPLSPLNFEQDVSLKGLLLRVFIRFD